MSDIRPAVRRFIADLSQALNVDQLTEGRVVGVVCGNPRDFDFEGVIGLIVQTDGPAVTYRTARLDDSGQYVPVGEEKTVDITQHNSYFFIDYEHLCRHVLWTNRHDVSYR